MQTQWGSAVYTNIYRKKNGILCWYRVVGKKKLLQVVFGLTFSIGFDVYLFATSKSENWSVRYVSQTMQTQNGTQVFLAEHWYCSTVEQSQQFHSLWNLLWHHIFYSPMPRKPVCNDWTLLSSHEHLSCKTNFYHQIHDDIFYTLILFHRS